MICPTCKQQVPVVYYQYKTESRQDHAEVVGSCEQCNQKPEEVKQ